MTESGFADTTFIRNKHPELKFKHLKHQPGWTPDVEELRNQDVRLTVR